jgi:hypothetical protein
MAPVAYGLFRLRATLKDSVQFRLSTFGKLKDPPTERPSRVVPDACLELETN